MRIPSEHIQELKKLLKKHYGLDYNDEQAQEAGRAILRFVGLKLHKHIDMEIYQKHDWNENGRTKRSSEANQ